jgi:REP element-mobilizing transposase RayT
MITYRLADSLPEDVNPVSETAQQRRSIEKYLDAGYGSCVLRRPDVARLVIRNWEHFDGIRYELVAWVVMPTHVHVMIRASKGQSLSRIVHSWKSYSAKAIVKMANVRRPVWHPDYWDRFIRDAGHFSDATEYIIQNPVSAGLVREPRDWPWSSAHFAGGPPAVPGC